jgi:hypothetical protein
MASSMLNEKPDEAVDTGKGYAPQYDVTGQVGACSIRRRRGNENRTACAEVSRQKGAEIFAGVARPTIGLG